jgi:hypothetical protein
MGSNIPTKSIKIGAWWGYLSSTDKKAGKIFFPTSANVIDPDLPRVARVSDFPEQETVETIKKKLHRIP